MFNMDDFEKMGDTNSEVPDGIIDASDYYNDMEVVTNILAGIDYDDMTSRLHGMMNLMNSTYDDDGDMVAIAKLPHPIKNLPDYDLNFLIRFDT